MPPVTVETTKAMLYAEVADISAIHTLPGQQMVSISGRIHKVHIIGIQFTWSWHVNKYVFYNMKQFKKQMYSSK